MEAEHELHLKLSADLKKAVATMTSAEARYLVDSYYLQQENRLRCDGQIRAMSAEPHGVIAWFSERNAALENQMRLALKRYAESQPMGRWALAVVGIGPVIAAGLLAHIDITKAPTVGHIWRYAGLDPTSVWKKGEKRPHNAALKVLCWKAGESFVKVSGKEEALYGRLYLERKALEAQKNEAGDYAAEAAKVLQRMPGHAQKAVYATGKLPAGHLHARAKRWAVKLFLAHWHEAAYRAHFQCDPPKPYAISHLGHAHEIKAA